MQSHKEHVLLIGADEPCIEIADDSLRSHGYRVTRLPNARRALEALLAPMWSGRACTAELLVLDLDGAHVDLAGFVNVLRTLASYSPPIMLLATQPVEALARSAAEIGAAGFMRKPFTGDDFLLHVRRSLGRRQTLAFAGFRTALA